MFNEGTLADVLDGFRTAAQTEYEAGANFEELIAKFLATEARYRDLYTRVLPYRNWAKERGLDARDTGIDLVAEAATGEVHAIQCKFFARDYKVQKSDIDSFFTASGKKPFTHRVIVTTSNNWNKHAEAALYDQQPPVTKIDYYDLENSQIDWARYQSKAPPVLKPKKELRDHQSRALKAVVKGLEAAERTTTTPSPSPASHLKPTTTSSTASPRSTGLSSASASRPIRTAASRNREFFRIAPERVQAALRLAQIREIKVGEEVFETAEDKADVEAAKRRSRFKLSMIGIKPGTVLQLAKDTNITCVTVDETNKVMFKDVITSLSDAAIEALRQIGIEWPTASGPWEWSYDGKRLDEIRREIEEAGS